MQGNTTCWVISLQICMDCMIFAGSRMAEIVHSLSIILLTNQNLCDCLHATFAVCLLQLAVICSSSALESSASLFTQHAAQPCCVAASQLAASFQSLLQVCCLLSASEEVQHSRLLSALQKRAVAASSEEAERRCAVALLICIRKFVHLVHIKWPW